MFLTEFRDTYLQRLLQLLWKQWCQLGILGYNSETTPICIDLEPLILATCSIGRYEPRLFDEMLDWLNANTELISMQRVKTFLKNPLSPITIQVIYTIADYFYSVKHRAKWKPFISELKEEEKQSFFFFKDGRPMESFGRDDPIFFKHGLLRGSIELRDLVEDFDPNSPACLQLRLRSLFGVSSRSDCLVYLLTHNDNPGNTPTQIAHAIGYAQKPIQDALVAMARSGLVRREEYKRDTRYYLIRETANLITNGLKQQPVWVNWGVIFPFFSQILFELFDQRFLESDSSIQSIKMRELSEKHIVNMKRSGLRVDLEMGHKLSGLEFLDRILQIIDNLLSFLGV